jgi:uncharacterized protein
MASAVYPSPQERKVLQATEKMMAETMSRYDPSHDAFHVQRVRRTALSIAQILASTSPWKPDLLTIEIAALLHDILDKKYVTAQEASAPYAFLLPFFKSMASEYNVDLISDGRARQIAKIVDNVSWTTEKKRSEAGLLDDWHKECVELHCVQDADRLDAIGAFGIMRCAAYSAVVNRPLHSPPSNSAQKEDAVQHFHDKLLKIRDRLKTEPGKQMSEKRHQLMLLFLSSVEEEYNNVDFKPL